MRKKRPGSYTVGIPCANEVVKICKVTFGADGSYYVSTPYHKFRGASLTKMTIDYNRRMQSISLASSIDFASAQNHKHGIKLSHHPDGFLQFSGGGIISGPGKNGFSLQSWNFDQPAAGPSFSVFAREFENFERGPISDQECLFYLPPERSIVRPNCVSIEGYFLPMALAARYIYMHRGEKRIKLAHPSGDVLILRVLEPHTRGAKHGIIGMHASFSFDATEPKHFLSVSSSTGNIRIEDGRRLGDALTCLYPAPPVTKPFRSVDYDGS